MYTIQPYSEVSEELRMHIKKTSIFDVLYSCQYTEGDWKVMRFTYTNITNIKSNSVV